MPRTARFRSVARWLLPVACALAATSTVHAEVVWRGDFETGDRSQWSSAQEVSADRLQVVADPVRQGAYALRVEVRQGDDPIDASGNRAELVWTVPEVEDNERYYAWSTLWSADYPYANTWQLFTQWHHSGNTGSPPLEIYVVGDEIRLRVNAETVVWTTPLERGVWHDFLLHVRWSSDPTVGFVELWFDGELTLPLTHAQNMYAGQHNYMKMGLYRNETIAEVGVLFHDGMTVATSLEDLTPTPAPADAGAIDATPDSGSAPPDGGHVADGGIVGPDAGAPIPADPDADVAGGCGLARRAGATSPAWLLPLLVLLGGSRNRRRQPSAATRERWRRPVRTR